MTSAPATTPDVPRSPGDILREPMAPVSSMLAPAFLWGMKAAPIVVGVLAVCVLVHRIAYDETPPLAKFAVWTFGWTLILIPLLAVARLFVISRAFGDRGFKVVGMGATFFGLGILLIFFAQLGREVYDWLSITPELVATRNEQLVERAKASDAQLNKLVAELDREMKAEIARDPAKKDEIEATFKQILVEESADLKRMAEEHRLELDTGLRQGTAPASIFWHFLSSGPAPVAQPQDAGILPALLGSLLVSLVTIAFAVPIGVGAAIYLEEYRANNLIGRIIQVNINNLAGVPSVVYGILGGLVFVEYIFKPLTFQFDWITARNTLGGGMTLALLTLPVVIVSAQEAIRAVPNSIRQGAYALGATRWQTIWRQVLPLAWPGIMTGTILALSRAIGEAAPLLLFGALQYVDQLPTLFSKFTILPMQIFEWSSRPPQQMANGVAQDVWRANAGLACVVLLIMLLGLNAIAIVVRNRAQRRIKF